MFSMEKMSSVLIKLRRSDQKHVSEIYSKKMFFYYFHICFLFRGRKISKKHSCSSLIDPHSCQVCVSVKFSTSSSTLMVSMTSLIRLVVVSFPLAQHQTSLNKVLYRSWCDMLYMRCVILFMNWTHFKSI